MVMHKRLFATLVLVVLVFSLLALSVLAHGDEADAGDGHDAVGNGATDKGTLIKHQALQIIYGAAALVALFTVLALTHKKDKWPRPFVKWILFLGIALPVVVATLWSAGTTIYVNTQSETGGPVHWHADVEIWDCGEMVDIIDPTGLSNRVGSPVFHEHNDNRIHVEGVVSDYADVSLSEFFRLIDGELHGGHLIVPTDNGVLDVEDGDVCDGGEGEVQVFLYRVTNPDEKVEWAYTQEKLERFDDYLFAPYSTVPPGDCLIVEFDVPKEQTDKLCSSYELAMQLGEMHGG
jgi:hypothetical protein